MFVSAMTSALTALININMRCIEIMGTNRQTTDDGTD